MFKRFSTNYIAILFLLDGFLVQVALWFSLYLRYRLPFGELIRPEWETTFFYAPGPALHFVVGLIWLISFLAIGVYTPRKIVFWFDELQRLVLAHTIAALSLAGLLYLAHLELLRLVYIYFYVGTLAALIGYRWALRIWHRLRRDNSSSVARILVVGAGKVGSDIVEEFQRQNWPGVDFVGFLDDNADKQRENILGLPILGSTAKAVQIIRQNNIDEVIVALPPQAHTRLANLVAELSVTPVRVRVVPDYFELAFFGATVENLGGIPLIGLRDPAIDGFQRFVKRLVDIGLSALGLLVMLPVLVTTAIAIRFDDGGPIFYTAPRVGENGRPFSMLKFRSMFVGADKMEHQIYNADNDDDLAHKSAADPRITRVGKFIRRTSIDELPQLINVLKGDMSLVGPRPELPWLVEKYEPWQRKRFAVPQGITGWWQINGRSDNLMHLHTDQDLYYIQNYSFWLDMQILWRTITVVLRGKGAY